MKIFHISSSGLKNIIFTSSENDDFRFIIGNKEISMKRFLADFISPRVSHIHHSDPTINSISLNDFILKEKQEDLKNIITPELIENLKQISSGNSIEIDEGMSHKLQFLSILIGNEEMYTSMIKLYPLKPEEKGNLDIILQFLEYLNFDTIKFSFLNEQLFESISGHFDSIEKTKLLNLPRSIIFSIISNSNLKVSNVDSLFDFINIIFSIKKDDKNDRKENLNLISFYETLDVQMLSENKFQEFIDSIDPEEMTQELWSKLKNYLKSNFLNSKKKKKK